MHNYGCNGNILCYHGVVERNRISSLHSHGKALEKECYYYYYLHVTSASSALGVLNDMCCTNPHSLRVAGHDGMKTSMI